MKLLLVVIFIIFGMFKVTNGVHVGDPYSDPYYLHNTCERNFQFDRENFDADGVRNDLDSQCYMHCLLGTIGVIDSSQQLHIDVLMPGIDDVSAHQLSSRCGSLRGSNICETAYLMAKCVQMADTDYVCSESEVKCSYYIQVIFFLSFQWKK